MLSIKLKKCYHKNNYNLITIPDSDEENLE